MMRFELRKRLISGFIVMLFLFIVINILLLKNNTSLFESIQKTHKHSYAVTLASLRIKVLIAEIHRSLKEASDPVNRSKLILFTKKIENYEKNALDQFEIVQKQMLSDAEKKMTVTVRDIFLKWNPIRQNIIKLVKNGESEKALSVVRKEGADYIEYLSGRVDEVVAFMSKKAVELNEESSGIASKARLITIISLILGVIFAILISVYLSVSITKRISKFTAAAKKIADGDLDQTLPENGNDEFSKLAASFNSMTEKLSESNEARKKNVRERVKEFEKTKREFELLRANLGRQVTLRTKELEDKVSKLNRSQKAMLFMVEDLNKTSKMLKTTQDELLLKERLAVLGQFSGSISHELRNPLGVIDSSAYFLRSKLKNEDPKILEHLNRIRSSIISAGSIIESLLNLTRMKKPRMEKNDLSEILSESIKNSRVPPKVKIIKNIPEKDIIVLSEDIQLRMAFKNIIKNAVEGMEGEGKLSIRISNAGNRKVDISFQDTGHGISNENLEKIFHPLFTTKSLGIGFGLAITKMIVENHNGSITVESSPGKGSIFKITLPLFGKSD